MSEDQSPTRELAHRVFAREFNDATYSFRESDEERAPVYALLPTGAKANRIFAVGTLTERENLGDESEYWRGRVVDPTSTFFVYAGQYQPEARATLRQIDPPAFVAVVGKPRTFETDSGEINVSVQPESVTMVDKTTRDRWVVEAAEPPRGSAEMAREQYSESVDTYREEVIAALTSLEDELNPDLNGDGTQPDSSTDS